ncbi:hypothetical protein EDB81DRAFT_846831 [Dactylonectria macrodidyma]|uniref:SWIRM domain-containing protein n=1 Tax=Dactylonectria macrodidyma TaxID=307937 RepID=A0A9P9IL09_9HYPO|nr:hypothetical protein EDB81DRAFT_846831 [Dactylonectria macrodidyma]
MANNSPRITIATTSMAPPAVPAASMGVGSKKFDITSLMSPPDPVLDSFSHSHHHSDMNKPATAGIAHSSSAKHPMPMSPPISPYSKPISTTDAPTTPPSQPVKDPLLYPIEDNVLSSPSQPPLFAPAEIEDHRRIVDDHVRARSQTSFAGVLPPKREDYELALTFRSQVMKHFTANRKAWLRKEPIPHILPAAKPVVASKAPRSQRVDRVSKPQSAPRSIRTHPGGTTTTPGPMRPAAPRPRVSATPEPSRRVVAPNREDKDFKALPNYCPPLNSLPSKPNSLKVDWKGQPIDLSSDPQAMLLHPDELTLAGNLRLDCATYLTSKRRIFERRLQCLRNGKEFRKTDAQQACKIDVNKASKLWTAFDKVGWLDADWVRQYL